MITLNFEDHSRETLIELYNKASEKYYLDGSSELTDLQFDELQKYLVEVHNFEVQVGSEPESGWPSNEHWYPMLSLAKVNLKDKLEISDFDTILRHFSDTSYTDVIDYSMKLDGLALSAQYENGQLIAITTRGNKIKGANVTDKFKCRIPNSIKRTDKIEIRCEAVMSKSNFEKYADSGKYKHPRNLVAGIKNNLDVNDERVQDVDLVVIDAITPDGTVIPARIIAEEEEGFTAVKTISAEPTYTAAKNVYDIFLEGRESYEYPSDGIVAHKRSKNNIRKHNGHNPSDAISIKFPPERAIAKVTHIEWNLSRLGNYIPVVCFEPTIVDGRTIRRASGHNYENIVKNGIADGAIVEISILGDIIPGISRVLKKSDVSNIDIPEDSAVVGVHLTATNASGELHRKAFTAGVLTLGFKGFGSKIIKNVYTACYNYFQSIDFNFADIFNPEVINNETLSAAGLGPSQRKSFIKFIADHKKDGIRIERIIRGLAIEGCGGTMSKELAKYFSGVQHDFSGLEKSVVESFVSEDGLNRKIFLDTMDKLRKYEVEIIQSVHVDTAEAEQKYMMTGSPKAFGFKTKKEFEETLPSGWVAVNNIKDATILFTDDLNSNSSKMKQAKARNIEIKTYK